MCSRNFLRSVQILARWVRVLDFVRVKRRKTVYDGWGERAMGKWGREDGGKAWDILSLSPTLPCSDTGPMGPCAGFF